MKLELLKTTNTTEELMVISKYRGGMKRFINGLNLELDLELGVDSKLEMRMSLNVLRIRAKKLEEVEWNSNHYTNFSGNVGHGYARQRYQGNHAERDNLERIEKLLAVYSAADDAVLTMLKPKAKPIMKIKTRIKVSKYVPTLNIKYKGSN